VAEERSWTDEVGPLLCVPAEDKEIEHRRARSKVPTRASQETATDLRMWRGKGARLKGEDERTSERESGLTSRRPGDGSFQRCCEPFSPKSRIGKSRRRRRIADSSPAEAEKATVP